MPTTPLNRIPCYHSTLFPPPFPLTRRAGNGWHWLGNRNCPDKQLGDPEGWWNAFQVCCPDGAVSYFCALDKVELLPKDKKDLFGKVRVWLRGLLKYLC